MILSRETRAGGRRATAAARASCARAGTGLARKGGRIRQLRASMGTRCPIRRSRAPLDRRGTGRHRRQPALFTGEWIQRNRRGSRRPNRRGTQAADWAPGLHRRGTGCGEGRTSALGRVRSTPLVRPLSRRLSQPGTAVAGKAARAALGTNRPGRLGQLSDNELRLKRWSPKHCPPTTVSGRGL